MDKTTMPPCLGPRTTALALAVLCVVLVPAAAQTPILYLCIEGAGRKEFTNTYKPGCKALDIPGAVPAPPSKGPPVRAASASTPADFPRVDSAQQKARDNDRRGILAEELRDEEARLAQLRAEFRAGQPDRRGDESNFAKYQERVKLMSDNLGRAGKNIEALRREIANTR